VQRLEDEYRRSKDAAHRDRLQIVRLAARDRPHHQIADDLGITTRTVQRWLNRYLEHGLTGLRLRKAKGAEAKIPADMADEVRRWVIEGPQAQGLDRANWTHAELAEHLFRTHGIRASRSAMQRTCQKLGIRVYRPTYRFLRGDPEKQAAAREDLAALKKGRKPARSSS
jgi:transposase